MVIASFFIIFVLHGSYGTYGVFFNPLQMEFGWSRTLISGANSLAFFFDGLFAVVAGRLTDRFGPRAVMVAAGFTVGLGYALLSQINTAWQLYFLYGVIIGMSTGSANVTLLSTTARWFVRQRGLMSGLVKVGTGAGILALALDSQLAYHQLRMAQLLSHPGYILSDKHHSSSSIIKARSE